jgi:hypothetical protein
VVESSFAGDIAFRRASPSSTLQSQSLGACCKHCLKIFKGTSILLLHYLIRFWIKDVHAVATERQQACLRQASAAASRLSLRRVRDPWSKIAGEDDKEGHEEDAAADAETIIIKSMTMTNASAIVMMRGNCTLERLNLTTLWHTRCIATICAIKVRNRF